ncbi:hypothetical protein [Occultella kanbiaonis]|uniref:hypothetical protein n=1 Tax=Occultella kanbiaonis TaxID=2675754 RepID=UPI0013D1239C|nr:hypothetical protein [Occultella kanbiaonis]
MANDEPGFKAPLSGGETFAGMDARVLDFWRFAMSDLQMNNLRGVLAEFLVARAVGSTSARVEWDAFDVLAPDGTRVEVKSSGYLQSWHQERLSAVTFQVRPSYGWHPVTGTYATERTFQADVYVFAHQTATETAAYDALDVSQWDFYVLPRPVVEGFAGSRVGLARVRLVARPVGFAKLGEAIEEAHAESL